jgi:hypothetical protein
MAGGEGSRRCLSALFPGVALRLFEWGPLQGLILGDAAPLLGPALPLASRFERELHERSAVAGSGDRTVTAIARGRCM